MDSVLTLEEWTQAVRHLKLKTARGICGRYAQELRDLPDLALEDLYHLFTATLPSMPSHLMRARTIPLGKTSHPDSASLTRPITTLSLLYRLWGRATTVKILRHWTKHFPSSVVGFLPARSLTNAMIGFQWKLEQAHLGDDVSYGGLTLDLIKAFNLIGREPAAEATLHYGLPPDWVQFWFASISSMDRVWEINGSRRGYMVRGSHAGTLQRLGPPVTGPTNTGGPSLLTTLGGQFKMPLLIRMLLSPPLHGHKPCNFKWIGRKPGFGQQMAYTLTLGMSCAKLFLNYKMSSRSLMLVSLAT